MSRTAAISLRKGPRKRRNHSSSGQEPPGGRHGLRAGSLLPDGTGAGPKTHRFAAGRQGACSQAPCGEDQVDRTGERAGSNAGPVSLGGACVRSACAGGSRASRRSGRALTAAQPGPARNRPPIAAHFTVRTGPIQIAPVQAGSIQAGPDGLARYYFFESWPRTAPLGKSAV